MVGRKFVTLSCGALYFLSAQIERANTPTFRAPVSAQNHQVLPSITKPTQRNPEIQAVSGMSREKLRDVLAIRFNIPTTFISWSHKVKTILAAPVIQQNCLATAVYFEARSESALGQLAVATVVLNRAQKSNSSICGVVYKGASYFNACQFSFACDGKPDILDDKRAWKASVVIANMAIAGSVAALSESMQILTIATNYHADYVNPKWSKQLTRLTKIGRHIFYSENPVVGAAGNRKNYI